ncbi:MAG: hypothetical protein R3B57_11625 [Phycisphaerales bacterium]
MAPPRSTGHRLCETIHLAAAGIWLGVLFMSGGVAAIIFKTTPRLSPHLGAFDTYTGDHARLAAGYIQNEVFKLTDVTQFVAALVCLGSMIALIAAYKMPLRSIVGAVRLIALMLALSALSYYMLILTPRMSENLRAFYAAAAAGENETAETFRLAFDADHPAATNSFAVVTIGVLVVFISGLWSVTGSARREAPARARRSELEEPALARGSRS